MSRNRKSNRRVSVAICCASLFCAVSLLIFSGLKAQKEKLNGVLINGEQENNSETSQPDLDNEDTDLEDEDADSQEPGLRFRRLSLQDEKGVVDPNGLRKARKQIEKMKSVQAQRSKARANELLEAAVAPDSWTWLGPGNIGGRIRTIAIKPNNANVMFIGSVGGGIWRSNNTGSTWFPVDDFIANLAVTTIVFDPVNNAIMYAGTGEGFGNGDALQGAGIFRSIDAGVTWTQLPMTNNANFNYVNRLAVSANGATILAATKTGVWRSTDGGGNWTLRNANPAADVKFHPSDNTRAVLGGFGTASYSIDGGLNWIAANFQPAIASNSSTDNGRVELAYAPSSPATVYASVNNRNGDLYVSNDGGKNYLRVNTGTNYMLGGAGNQGWYDNALWVNPSDANMVIVGGINLYRSTNGGLALTQISDGSAGSAHADQHVIVSSPNFNNNSNKIVFFGNDGGLYHTDDVANVNTQTWLNNNSQLGITQFYGAAGNQSSGVIVGGAQDNGMLRYTNGTEFWTHMSGNDGGFAAADQTDPNYFYGENQNLVILRSTNGGISSMNISGGIGDVAPQQTNFIAPLALDPNEPNRLLAGGWSLWRTQNAKDTAPDWSAIKGQTGGSSPVSTIAISPTNSAFIVVGHNNGYIYYTFNGTADAPAWTKIDTAGVPDRFVTRLVVDPTRSPNWIYATFGGFSADNVYVTKNFGTTWTQVTGTGATALPGVPVRSLVIHPSNPNLLYVGTEVGIFTSEDAGANWDLPNGGPANVSVDELFWMGGDLIAATHGRGLYRASGGLYVDCNYTGTQLGTFDQPFRTINAAINAVSSYRPIWLKPCNYNEQIDTNKRLEIRKLGGTAQIGTP